MSDTKKALAPIIVKKIKKGGHGHHGGAWKIAYADFVTAMMAFFLLMWLLGSTSQGDLQGIAEFFQNPAKISRDGGKGSGDATSLIPGGGEDLTRSAGQVRRGAPSEGSRLNPRTKVQEQAARVKAEKAERAKLNELKQKIEEIIKISTTLQPLRDQIKLEITSEGLRIQIVDEQNRPMFDLGGTTVREHMTTIMREIGPALNEVPNKITLSGHTDALPFVGQARSNWELSAERANAARRELIAGGLDAGKILQVRGLADKLPFLADDPRHPSNRRISIVVLNSQSEDAFYRDAQPLEVSADGSIEGDLEGLDEALPEEGHDEEALDV